MGEVSRVQAMRIQLRLNRNDQDYDQLFKAMHETLEGFSRGRSEQQEGRKSIRPIAQSVLKRERERLKDDLREAEK